MSQKIASKVNKGKVWIYGLWVCESKFERAGEIWVWLGSADGAVENSRGREDI